MEYVLQKGKKWSVGQGVKTPPFHGGNTRMTVNHDVVGSSPTGGARFKKSNANTFDFFFLLSYFAQSSQMTKYVPEMT